MLRVFAVVAVVLAMALGCSSEPPAASPTDFSLEVDVDSADEASGRLDEVATLTLDRPAQAPVEVMVSTQGAVGLQPTESLIVVEAGQTQATIGVVVHDNTTVGPDQTYTIHVDALGRSDSFDFTVTDDEPHGLAIEGPSSATEGSGLVSLTLRAAGTLDEAVLTTLSAEPTGVVEIPTQLSLEPGRRSWQLEVLLPDDTLLHVDRSVTITATPDHLLEAPAPFALVIEDDEPATLTLHATATDLTESDGVITDGAQVTLGAPAAADTVVLLESSNPDVLSVPAQVTVPALADAASIDLTLVDNAVFDGEATVAITASAEHFTGDELAFTIADDDTPTLQLAVQSTNVTEGDGTLAAWGKVSLGVTTGADQVITLASSDDSELTLPSTVTIAGGTDSVDFAITVEDDAWLDFAQEVTLTASAGDWHHEAQVTVADDEPNQLTVVVDAVEIREDSGQVFDSVHVRTAAPVEAPLQVDLASSDTSELQVQLQVRIPAGETSTPVNLYVNSGVDGVPDQDKTVEITATAAGCTAGSGQVVIQDLDSGYVVQLMQSPGVEQWVGFPGIPSLMYDTDWAFAMRVMIPTGADTFGYTFFRGQAWEDQTGDFSVELQLDNPQVKLLFLNLTMDAGDSGITLTEGTWHTLVVQYDNATTTAALYMDGVLVSEWANAAKDDRTNSHLMVWGGQYNQLSPPEGEVYNESDVTFAHMAIWQRRLTSQEIADYDGSAEVNDPDIVFSSAIGHDGVYDLVGSRNGTVHGSPTFHRP